MLGRLFGRGRAKTGAEAGWALAVSVSGDVLLALPDGTALAGPPVVTIGDDGSVSVGTVGKKSSIALPEPHALTAVASSASVIVSMRRNGILSFSVAPVLRKGQRPQISLARGKIHKVTVERIADDGSMTGVWRGHVSLNPGVPEVFVELAPSFPIPVGSRIRIVGVMDALPTGSDRTVRMRFRSGAWVPLTDRGLLFTDGGVVRLASSSGEGGRRAWRAMEKTLSELSTLRHREKGTKIALPMIRVRMEGSETPAQKSMRSRLQAANNGVAKPGSGGGRRMKISSTDWHGAVQKNGDLVLEIRRKPFAEPPAKVTVIVNRDLVTTLDGLSSRVGLRCAFADGGITMMLLGGGPQELASDIARRKSVVVVQGMPGAETYADVHVSIADVEKR